MQSIEKWIIKANSNKRLVEKGRWVNLTFTFGIGKNDYLFEIIEGKVISSTKRTVLTKSGIFKIHGERDAWEKHWFNIPPRDYHDIFAMLAKKLIIIDGNLTPFMQNLQYFKDLIASNRQSNN
jgi:hypothetical protein|tara:strand:+ start:205 stop:573 length:369 start_codon:yes stop_codon:yes gene_type:complete